jgi:hypothetical protein
MKKINPTRYASLFAFALLLLTSCGKGTENENSTSTSETGKAAAPNDDLSTITGTYTFGKGNGEGLSGQLEIHAQEGPDKQSEFSIFVSDPQSSGYLHGALMYHGDGEFTFESSEDGMDCKMILKFSGDRVTVSYLEDRKQCATAVALGFDGTFTKKSEEKPDFSEDHY